MGFVFATAIKLSSGSHWQTVVTRRLLADAGSFWIRITSGNQITVTTYHGGNSENYRHGEFMTIDQWYDVVVGCDGWNRWIYIDGLLVDKIATAAEWDGGEAYWWLGADELQSSQRFWGEQALPSYVEGIEPLQAEVASFAYARALYLGI